MVVRSDLSLGSDHRCRERTRCLRPHFCSPAAGQPHSRLSRCTWTPTRWMTLRVARGPLDSISSDPRSLPPPAGPGGESPAPLSACVSPGAAGIRAVWGQPVPTPPPPARRVAGCASAVVSPWTCFADAVSARGIRPCCAPGNASARPAGRGARGSVRAQVMTS